MKMQETNEIRELTTAEVNEVTGGVNTLQWAIATITGGACMAGGLALGYYVIGDVLYPDIQFPS